jgi:hypothetical protein
MDRSVIRLYPFVRPTRSCRVTRLHWNRTNEPLQSSSVRPLSASGKSRRADLRRGYSTLRIHCLRACLDADHYLELTPDEPACKVPQEPDVQNGRRWKLLEQLMRIMSDRAAKHHWEPDVRSEQRSDGGSKVTWTAFM